MPFPYSAILKQAYDFTRHDIRIWIFGVFVSIVSELHFLLLSIFFSRSDWEWFASILAAMFVVLYVSALSRACLILAAQKLANREHAEVKAVFFQGGQFAKQIFFLQISVLGLMILAVAIFGMPVIYLASLQEVGRTVVLGITGAAVLLPLGFLLGFMLLYSPILSVLYKLSFRQALTMSFQFARVKWKESLVMAAWLAAISFGFMLATGFGIMIAGVPIILIGQGLAVFGLAAGMYAVLLSGGLLCVLALIVLLAGLAVFTNFAWVLTVMELVKTIKDEDLAKATAPEAEPA